MKRIRRRVIKPPPTLIHRVLSIVFLFLFPLLVHAEIIYIANTQTTEVNGNRETSLRLSDATDLRVIEFTNPSLSVFKDATGLFEETRHSLFSLGRGGPQGKLQVKGTMMGGLIYMPNYAGYEYSTIQETIRAEEEERAPQAIDRSTIEKTLALLSYRLEGDYSLSIPLFGETSIKLGLDKDIYARLAYNFYDLAPMLDYIREYHSLGEAFANYYTGASFSCLKDATIASIGLEEGKDYYIGAFGKLMTTDLLYSDYSVGFDYAWKDRWTLQLAYDFASYGSYNGESPEKFRFQFFMRLRKAAQFASEAIYQPQGIGQSKLSMKFVMTIHLPASSEKAHRENLGLDHEVKRSAEIRRFSDSKKELGGLMKLNASSFPVKEIDEDLHSILSMRNRPFQDVVNILYTYRSQLSRYDYSRATDIFASDRLRGKTAEDYLDKGGACIDIANFVATVLDNNSYKTRVVLAQSLKGSPHSYVVAQDGAGAFYALDGFSYANRIDSADSFSAAAAMYQGGFTQMILRDLAGHVDAVLVSPDMEMLDSVMMD